MNCPFCGEEMREGALRVPLDHRNAEGLSGVTTKLLAWAPPIEQAPPEPLYLDPDKARKPPESPKPPPDLTPPPARRERRERPRDDPWEKRGFLRKKPDWEK